MTVVGSVFNRGNELFSFRRSRNKTKGALPFKTECMSKSSLEISGCTVLILGYCLYTLQKKNTVCKISFVCVLETKDIIYFISPCGYISKS